MPFFFFFSFLGFFSPQEKKNRSIVGSSDLVTSRSKLPFSSSFFCRFSLRFCSFISWEKCQDLSGSKKLNKQPLEANVPREHPSRVHGACIFKSASSCCFRKALGPQCFFGGGAKMMSRSACLVAWCGKYCKCLCFVDVGVQNLWYAA